MKRILITGAAGQIGSALRQGLRGRYPLLRLTDIAPLDPAPAGEEIVNADLSDLAAVEAAMRDVACVRIGAFRDMPADRLVLHVWLSPRDVVQLVGCCIDAPDYHFIVVYGVSDNARNRYRNAGFEYLGYRPQDKADDHADDILRS